ncbi:hypothetical protein EJB05_47109, partial [Eragrostis curvula]
MSPSRRRSGAGVLRLRASYKEALQIEPGGGAQGGSVPANAAKPHATTAAAPVALRKPVFTTIDQLRRLMATPSSPASSPPAPSSISPPRTSADPASQSASSETKLAPSANCLLLLVDP